MSDPDEDREAELDRFGLIVTAATAAIVVVLLLMLRFNSG